MTNRNSLQIQGLTDWLIDWLTQVLACLLIRTRVNWMNEWMKSRGWEDNRHALFTIHFNMWRVSSDVSIQRRHWQLLSVHLWAYRTHPTHDVNDVMSDGWSQHRGLRPLLFSNSGVGSFTSHKKKSVKVLWDGTYGFSSLSEKTRKSNHLQMSLQRQHFLLSYLKTLNVGPAGVRTRDLPLSRRALSQLS